MSSLFVAAVALTLVIVPSSAAFACGACVDINLQRAFWGAPSLGILAGLLLLEVLVTGVVYRVRRYTPFVRRARWLLLASVVGVVGSLGLGGSGLGLASGVVVVLLPAYVRSLSGDQPWGPRTRTVRLTAGVLAWLCLSMPLHPAMRPTEALVGLASAPVGGSRPGWVLDELRRRDDALPLLTARARDGEGGAQNRALALHRRLTSAEEHASLCEEVLDGMEPEQQRALPACDPARPDPSPGEHP